MKDTWEAAMKEAAQTTEMAAAMAANSAPYAIAQEAESAQPRPPMMHTVSRARLSFSCAHQGFRV